MTRAHDASVFTNVRDAVTAYWKFPLLLQTTFIGLWHSHSRKFTCRSVIK